MELRLKTFYQSPHGPALTDLFGYCSMGMPSLEVHSSVRGSRMLKEKLLYLTKSRKMRLPPRRYVLCIDTEMARCSIDTFTYFELPFLILFWSLAEVLPIKRLNDCVCSGKVQVNGVIIAQELSPDHLRCLTLGAERLKVIGVEREGLSPFPLISLQSLMKGVQNIWIQG